MAFIDFKERLFGELISAAVLAEAGASDGAIVEVPLSELPESKSWQTGWVFGIRGKLVANGTAPGTPKTVTLNLYWAPERITTLSTVPTLCTVVAAQTPWAVANTASVTRYYVASGNLFVPQAPFLYLSLTHSALAAGATLTATVWLKRS